MYMDYKNDITCFYLVFPCLQIDAVKQIKETIPDKIIVRKNKRTNEYKVMVKINETDNHEQCLALKAIIISLNLDSAKYFFKFCLFSYWDNGGMSIPLHISQLHADIGGNIFISRTLKEFPNSFLSKRCV